MATKTITIDVDVYERLQRVQKWLAAIDRAPLSRQAAGAIDRRRPR